MRFFMHILVIVACARAHRPQLDSRRAIVTTGAAVLNHNEKDYSYSGEIT